MRKKGFTLVELLAVIAILAILVIVAMPNVLGMFNQTKVNSFVTEVQKIMDTATSSFANDALLNSGETIYYSSESNATLGTKELDMSGNKKNYFIEMDRNGEFKRVVVYDDNYCYDVSKLDERSFERNSFMINYTSSLNIGGEIKKTSVVMSNVWESGNDSMDIVTYNTMYTVKGCEGNVNVSNNKLKVISIEGFGNYLYEDGMTWEDWVNSEYNVDGFYILGRLISMDVTTYREFNIFDKLTYYLVDALDLCHIIYSSDVIDNSRKFDSIDVNMDLFCGI